MFAPMSQFEVTKILREAEFISLVGNNKLPREAELIPLVGTNKLLREEEHISFQGGLELFLETKLSSDNPLYLHSLKSQMKVGIYRWLCQLVNKFVDCKNVHVRVVRNTIRLGPIYTIRFCRMRKAHDRPTT